MDHTNVIIKPLVTEKSTHQQATRNAYAFQVHAGANKQQIKHAVEKIYDVKVTDVQKEDENLAGGGPMQGSMPGMPAGHP